MFAFSNIDLVEILANLEELDQFLRSAKFLPEPQNFVEQKLKLVGKKTFIHQQVELQIFSISQELLVAFVWINHLATPFPVYPDTGDAGTVGKINSGEINR